MAAQNGLGLHLRGDAASYGEPRMPCLPWNRANQNQVHQREMNILRVDFSVDTTVRVLFH